MTLLRFFRHCCRSAANAASMAFLLITLCSAVPASAQTFTAAPIYPADGATGVDMLREFEWTAVPGAEAYYLYVGTTPGAKDLVNSGELQTTRYFAVGVPADTLAYGRIWTKVAAVWRYADFTFTTSAAPAFRFVYPAVIGGDADLRQPIEWTSVPNAQAYYLYVGSTPGAKDIVNTGEVQQTSFIAYNLPTRVMLYARIWVKVAGSWSYVDTRFTATATASQTASLVYPTNGLAGADMTQPIRWSTALHAQSYYLSVGTSPGARDLINSGETLATQFPATNLPTGQTLYARLWTKMWGIWLSTDTSFTASAALAGGSGISTFTYPTNGSAADVSQGLQWTAVPNAQAYYLYVGTTPAGKDVVNSGEMTQTSYSAWGLPIGQTLYARLWTKTGGIWRYSDISFTAAPYYASLITPPDGAAQIDPVRPFEWTTVPNREKYYLYVGSAPGLKDLIDSQETTGTTWNGLNGGKSQGLGQLWRSQKLYVRLWTRVAGIWRYNDSTFTTATLVSDFVYPLDGSVRVDLARDFEWTAVPNAQAYRLTVSRLCGDACKGNPHLETTLVDSGEINRNRHTVSNLPANEPLLARVWVKYNDVWRYTDSTFTRGPKFSTGANGIR